MNEDMTVAKPLATCIPQEQSLHNVQLAHAYVPFQKLCNTFRPLDGFRKGTIFPELYDVYGWERKGREDDCDDE
ncbi:MAG: spore coat associated protein CotJA [Clostridiaceae bacterium]|nr:spore coat associated protein CotJA [Clostridiaceae bacterium]